MSAPLHPIAVTAITAAAPAAHDVLCVGLLCADLAFTVPQHPAPDEKLRATARHLAPGGPAAVAAAQIARLGGRIAFAGLIGDDPFASLLRSALAAEGIDTSALLALPDHPTPLATLLVKPDATRTVISHRPEPRQSVTKLVTLPPARILLADGHRPDCTPALLAHARATSAPLVLDAGSWSDSIRELAPHADHLVASEACARAALAGRDPTTVPPAELRAALIARADATIVVTLGPRGLLWQTPAAFPAHGTVPAFRIDAVDTTGAGDAFHGAYALGLARGITLPDLLRLASAAGALACTRPGAWNSLATSAEINALLTAT
jgi:sugar/nucleoside kinase (ribokinase family)